jgi:hypothetical protein
MLAEYDHRLLAFCIGDPEGRIVHGYTLDQNAVAGR